MGVPNRKCFQADLNDKASLVKAMTGVAAVFAVTNYWEKMDAKLEIQQGKSLVDAAKETGVRQFIWSSLVTTSTSVSAQTHAPSASQPLMYPPSSNTARASVQRQAPHVYHFDSKAEVEDCARQAGIPANLLHAGLLYVQPAGQHAPQIRRRRRLDAGAARSRDRRGAAVRHGRHGQVCQGRRAAPRPPARRPPAGQPRST